MTSIQANRAVHGTSGTPARSSDATGTSSSNFDLMPAPAEHSGCVLNDALSLLYELKSRSGEANRTTSENEQKITAAERKEQSRKMSDALDKQIRSEQGKGFFKQFVNLCVDAIQVRPDLLIKKTIDNCKDIAHDPKFWKDLAKGAMTVAKIAAATIAVAGIIAGPAVMGTVGFAVAVFSACAMLESELQIMEKLGVDGKTAGHVRLGAAAATAVVSLGSLATAGATAVKSSAQAANAASNAAKLQQGAVIVGRAAKLTQPIADTTAKGATTAKKIHERRTQNFFADAETHRFDKEAIDRRLKAQIKDAIASVESDEKSLGLLKQAMLTRQQSTLNLAGSIGGRA